MLEVELPRSVMEYIRRHTKTGSEARRRLIELLARIARGEKVYVRDVKPDTTLYIHVRRMVKEGILMKVYTGGEPSWLAKGPKWLS